MRRNKRANGGLVRQDPTGGAGMPDAWWAENNRRIEELRRQGFDSLGRPLPLTWDPNNPASRMTPLRPQRPRYDRKGRLIGYS